MSEIQPEPEQWKIWKSPSGGTYKISNYGNVYRKYTTEWRVTGKAISSGYRNFGGVKKGVRWMRYVHRMVAELFIENPDNLAEVDHMDRNRLNNFVGNLRWASRQQNAENMCGHGCYKRGNRWVAHIRSNGKKLHLGCFDTEAEARACYLGAKKIAHTFWADR